METRKITVISTKTNRKVVINSAATTLGELKRDLREAGVDFTDMTFYEGLTKTELKSDSSLLPHDVERINPMTHEPETTNELAFMLTNTNKKIKSGADLTRKDLYNLIKEMSLQEACVVKFGKNYTQCSTAALYNLVTEAKQNTNARAKMVNVEKPETKKPDTGCVDTQAREALRVLVNTLYNDAVISSSYEILSILDGKEGTKEESPYTDSMLDEMFADMTD